MDNFRETMSRVCNTVSVVALSSNHTGDKIHAVTISSLVSTSVDDNYKEVMFVIKTNSFLLKELTNETRFSINVLSNQQRKISEYYGRGAAKKSENLDNFATSWVMHETIPELLNAHLTLHCVFLESQVRRNSTVVFAQVTCHKHLIDSSPLVHFRRNYHEVGSIC